MIFQRVCLPGLKKIIIYGKYGLVLIENTQVPCVNCAFPIVVTVTSCNEERNKFRHFAAEKDGTEVTFYPRDAMLARVFAIATCLSVCLSVRPPHAGIVPSRAKAGS